MSSTSLKILRLLAREWNYFEIAGHMGMTLEKLHSQLYCIRKATGIKSTKDSKVCKAFLYNHGDSQTAIRRAEHTPTPNQLRCMVMLAKCKSVRDIGASLGISSSTVRNHIAAGLKTAGIKRMQLYAHLRDLGLLQQPPAAPITMEDPEFN